MTQKPDTSEQSKVSHPQDRPGARVLSASGEGRKGVRRLGKHISIEREVEEKEDAQ